MKYLLLILICLPAIINCDGLFVQRFSSTHKVKVQLGMVLPGNTVEAAIPIDFVLDRDSEKSYVLPVEQHSNYSEFTVTLYHMLSDTQLGPTLHRRFPTVRTDDYQEDVYKMAHTVLTVRSRYECLPNFFGPNCAKQCNSEIESLSRHRCDNITGDLRCDIGYMGEKCATRLDPRQCGCQHSGICVTQALNNTLFECECQKGTSGEKCENLITVKKSDVDNSHICSAKHTCLNGGECIANGLKPYCQCRDGFIGEFCQAFTEPATTMVPQVANETHTLLNLLIILIVLAIGAAVVYMVRVLVKPSLPFADASFQELLSRYDPTSKLRQIAPPPYSDCTGKDEDNSPVKFA